MIEPDRLNYALRRFNQRLFENLSPAVRTFRRFFQNVIRHARIGSGDPVENVIERNLSTFLIAVLAGFDHPLRQAENRRLDEHDNLLLWCWVEEVAGHWNRILAF